MFRVSLNGNLLPDTLGTKGSVWEWQYAGSINLGKGEATLVLKDMSGFDGRCDAVYMTTQQNPVLPNSLEDLESFRRSLGALPQSCLTTKSSTRSKRNMKEGNSYGYLISFARLMLA